MIRHEETLVMQRAVWLVALQTLLVTGFTFSWEQKDLALTLIFVFAGILAALMFVPHFRHGDRAILRLESWWGYHIGGYAGPDVIVLPTEQRHAWLKFFLHWLLLPVFFAVGWAALLIVKLLHK